MSDFSPVEVARIAAGRIGLGPVEPKLLAVSEHVVLHLAPAPVVARMRPAKGEVAMRCELDVVRYLAERGAPVLTPLPGDLVVEQGMIMSFWPLVSYWEAEESVALDSLRQVHSAFADYPGRLPDFADKVASCHALLLSVLPALSDADCRFLLAVHDEIAPALNGLERVPLHGDAGLHNLMMTGDGPLWTDFEAACRGPRDWDFASLGQEETPLMAAARSFCVSVWCWARPDLPGKREAAEYHLEQLRRR